ncbi:superoxide dismutase [Candidatus Roizmanbacteria bacterium RIFCSPHIGHO2_12_FULL_41_11]|uniref:Superoxide dismutase n=3 Tax=Candidatus Roizmaniibacteriota TaxID=1752723 RepID=A0A1F7JRW8_9BACT|nr:MAG: superoxide dismutase [Candidatus Roizmanbacteria bacterium RIFCSPHIGHO2_12_FULL_41_11]OGK52239.1 MAG: superoxide dismutase [Candidatus Roizmanbacteria bacterium RIFCSPLOWO2_01_FULL_41_22]OGK58362.1 MAG: superoxide dismutase [Candidatus Roizmanbacteria bacterium RIFCSPLOWO2_02_FULL_41_9]
MQYFIPALPYDYKALEPYIDEATMHYHHDKHHQAYVDKLNAVVAKHAVLQKGKLEDLMKNLDSLDIPESDKKAFRNNGGGHLNHTLYFEVMGPQKQIDETLLSRIKQTFGSLETMQEEFNNNALTQFGSGWSWLVEDTGGNLKLYSTANQDSPFLQGHKPIIGLDVWEHAYYLKYQNKRGDYIKAWWRVLKFL